MKFFYYVFVLKILILLAMQVTHFYLALITLFVIATFLEQYSLYYYCTLNNKFACFYNVGNILLELF